jgi:iron complex outermembrane receptor protein
MRNHIRSRGVLAAAIALACGTAQAQQAPAAGVALDEVIVTAQKRAENVLTVPLSISVVAGEKLQDFGLVDLRDIQTYIPNLAITQTPSNSFVYIRGIGTAGLTLSFESSVALFVDGIYGGRNRQFVDPFLDIDRVEVLRGPQGALFGRNTSAGAISVSTARPTEDFQAWTQGDYEAEFGTWSVSGAVSGPVTDTLRLRFAGKYLDDPGYLENTRLGRDEADRRNAVGRLSGEWEPSETIDVIGRLEYADVKVVGMPFEFVPARGKPVLRKNPDDALGQEGDEQTSTNAMVQANVEIGRNTLTAIAGYSEFEYEAAINIQAKSPTILLVRNAEDFDQRSFEVRWLSPTDGTFNYVVGGYADSATSRIPSSSTTDLPFTPIRPDTVTRRNYREETDSYAVFAQGTWNFLPTARAVVGARYTSVDKTGDLQRSVTGNAQPGTLTNPLSAERNESFFDPSVNLQWDFAPGWMTFATYAQGSKSGGFSPSMTDTAATWQYEPEESESIEVGVKGGTSRANLSVVLFDTKYENLQRSSLDITTSTFLTGNAAEASSQGVELEAAWRPLDVLRLNASLAYLDAKFDDYPGAPCPFGVPGRSCNLAGFPLTNAPQWSGTAAADLQLPISAALKFIGGLVVTYRDDVQFQPSYNPLESQESWTKLDVRAGLAAADDRWSATLLVRNATDENTSSIIFETLPIAINPATDRVFLPDRPRTYTLQLRYRFD